MDTIKSKVKVTIWYFKPSGKFYTECEWETECRVSTGLDKTVIMSDLTNKIRGLNGAGQESMPGLSSDSWDGYVVLNCEDGFPCLIDLRGSANDAR